MMARVFLMVVALLIPTLSWAQSTALVRSGDHDGFTRIVVDFGSRPEWSLERKGESYLLVANPAPARYDLSQAFRLIGRDRVADLRPDADGAGLWIDLACDCEAVAFPSGNDAVVLDLRAATDDRDGPDVVDMPPVLAAVAGETDGSTPARMPEAARRPDAPVLTVPVVPTSFKPPVAGANAPDPDAGPRPETADFADELTERLSHELARATAQGLLEPDEEIPPGLPDGGRIDAAASDDTQVGTATIRIRTGIDRAFEGIGRSNGGAETLATCLAEDALDISVWGEEDDPPAQIAAYRRELVGEFDMPDPVAPGSLARLYLYLTFGAEARQLLLAYAASDPDRAALLELASLMDFEDTTMPIIASQRECGGFAPLWAFLADGNHSEEATIEDILYAFNVLPAHLRRHFAPRLTERLADAGEHDAVDVVVASLSRVASRDDPALILSQARGPASALAPHSEDDGLMKLARTVHPEASMALLLQIEELVSSDRTVPQDLVDTAAILAFERAGTSDGNRLKAAEIDARTANAEVLQGFRVLAHAVTMKAIDGPLYRRSRDRVLDAAARHLIDADVARIAFDERSVDLFSGATPELRSAFADRVLALGFGDRAKVFFPALEDSVFEARVARSKGDLSTAVRLIESVPHTDDFLADVLSESAQHYRAAQLYLAEGLVERGMEEAWRAGDWKTVAGQGAGNAKTAADLMVGLVDDQPRRSDGASLAVSSALIDESISLREALDGILAQPEP